MRYVELRQFVARQFGTDLAVALPHGWRNPDHIPYPRGPPGVGMSTLPRARAAIRCASRGRPDDYLLPLQCLQLWLVGGAARFSAAAAGKAHESARASAALL